MMLHGHPNFGSLVNPQIKKCPMLFEQNRLSAQEFWCAELGAANFARGVHLQAHNPRALWNLADQAVYFEHANGVFITIPQEYLADLRSVFETSPRTPLDTFLSEMYTKGSIVGNGPAYLGYLDGLEGPELPVCSVDHEDSRVQEIAQEHPIDWDVFGPTEQSVGLFAVVEEGRILGLSHYEVWGGVIAHIGVLTITSARGNGIGELVVRQAAQDALKRNLLPQYRTLWSNKSSIRISQKVGFSHFATTVWVRL